MDANFSLSSAHTEFAIPFASLCSLFFYSFLFSLHLVQYPPLKQLLNSFLETLFSRALPSLTLPMSGRGWRAVLRVGGRRALGAGRKAD